MDKATPKGVCQANCDRAAPLLAKLKTEGIGHAIDGRPMPSISGQTFETKSPIDGAVLAFVARGNAVDIDRAATAAARAFKSSDYLAMIADVRAQLPALERVITLSDERAAGPNDLTWKDFMAVGRDVPARTLTLADRKRLETLRAQ